MLRSAASTSSACSSIMPLKIASPPGDDLCARSLHGNNDAGEDVDEDQVEAASRTLPLSRLPLPAVIFPAATPFCSALSWAASLLSTVSVIERRTKLRRAERRLSPECQGGTKVEHLRAGNAKQIFGNFEQAGDGQGACLCRTPCRRSRAIFEHHRAEARLPTRWANEETPPMQKREW